ncbi:MAG: HAMP domain-containing histidine kinase [Xanthomonadales bacterium]|nr:HAMP domain-containing histidine kinase [Xanthomonadales bacterium]
MTSNHSYWKPFAVPGTDSVIPRKLLRSSIFRLALFYTGLSTVSMLLLLVFIYWATAGYMAREIDATIDEEVLGLEEQYHNRGINGIKAGIEERISLSSNRDALYLLGDGRYQPMVGNLDRWPIAAKDKPGWLRFTLPGAADDDSPEVPARARSFDLPNGMHLLIGHDLRDLEATRGLFIDALGWSVALTLGIALGIGLIMSFRVSHRIETINQTSREIMEGDLSQRIPDLSSGDEFDQLASNLNRMLDRIQALMTSVHRVSDHIAHDLRTPLSRLRTRLEQIKNRAAGSAGDTVERAIEDVDDLLATFNALLRIARIESGSPASSFVVLDLQDLLRDLAELYEPVAADKEQQIEVLSRERSSVEGDRDLLFQVLANLVDNAIKYTPPGGTITLAAAASPAGSQVEVTDTGPGIPRDLREKVFQRFYRCDTSRSTTGSGLGLSLVRAIVDLHGARIRLSDNKPGLRVTIVFRPPPRDTESSGK